MNNKETTNKNGLFFSSKEFLLDSVPSSNGFSYESLSHVANGNKKKKINAKSLDLKLSKMKIEQANDFAGIAASKQKIKKNLSLKYKALNDYSSAYPNLYVYSNECVSPRSSSNIYSTKNDLFLNENKRKGSRWFHSKELEKKSKNFGVEENKGINGNILERNCQGYNPKYLEWKKYKELNTTKRSSNAYEDFGLQFSTKEENSCLETQGKNIEISEIVQERNATNQDLEELRFKTSSPSNSTNLSNNLSFSTHFMGFFNLLLSNILLSALLLFVPLGILAYQRKWHDELVFFFNFIAIIPLSWLIGKSTEDLAARTGQVLGGLLNASFGNVVEMLLCLAGLRRGELIVVKSTLIGSILSNLLLVLGCSFFFGGLFYKVQKFSSISASTSASLMTLSCLCLGLPTIYAAILSSAHVSELHISRSVSILLALTYIQYLIFQLGTHSFLFAGDEEEEEVDLTVATAAVILAVTTILTSFSCEYVIYAIEGVVNSWNISKGFIGIVLLPIIGNAAEHYTSVMVAIRNKMDLSLGCAVGSSCQMALFVTPFTILAAWAMGIPLSLDFHPFETAVLLLAVLIMMSILQDGYSNWLEGYLLITAYSCIALIYFFEEPSMVDIL